MQMARPSSSRTQAWAEKVERPKPEHPDNYKNDDDDDGPFDA